MMSNTLGGGRRLTGIATEEVVLGLVIGTGIGTDIGIGALALALALTRAMWACVCLCSCSMRDNHLDLSVKVCDCVTGFAGAAAAVETTSKQTKGGSLRGTVGSLKRSLGTKGRWLAESWSSACW